MEIKQEEKSLIISRKGTAISLGLTIILLLVAYNYGALSDSVKANASNISKVEQVYQKDIGEIKNDIGEVKTSVGNIEGYLRAKNENDK